MTAVQVAPGHRQALDGLRALAILAVMLVHAGSPGFHSGWVGVDLFFVLSGFLITTLLMDEVARSGAVNWPFFMARRALRLTPAYAIYAGFVTGALWLWPGSVHETASGWSIGEFTAALWTYTINFVPKGGVWNGQGLTVHLWSLAVEQQYYLVWPLLVLLLHRRLAWLLGLAALLGLVFLIASVLWPSGMAKSAMLCTRGFSLVLASAVAIAAHRAPERFAAFGVARFVSLLGGLALLAMFALPYLLGWSEEMVRDRLLPLVVPAFAVWVVRLWYLPSQSWICRTLQRRVLVYVGQVSYGIYLYHEAIRIGVWVVAKPLMESWPPALGYGVRLVVYLGLSVALAGLSFKWIEKPCQNLSRHFRAPRKQAPKSAPEEPLHRS
ncbi:MAG: acyltransferase [Burkholderiales bacterium]|nr:acyltransferase [Burkholderiales bacterium]